MGQRKIIPDINAIIVPSLLDAVTIPLKPSTTNKNRKGDIGQPYLRPAVGKKILDAEPFNNIAKEAMERHPSIQFTI